MVCYIGHCVVCAAFRIDWAADETGAVLQHLLQADISLVLNQLTIPHFSSTNL